MQEDSNSLSLKPFVCCPCSVCFQARSLASDPSGLEVRSGAVELYNYSQPLGFGSVLPCIPLQVPSPNSFPPLAQHRPDAYVGSVFVPENRLGFPGGHNFSEFKALHEAEHQAFGIVSETPGEFWRSSNGPREKQRRMRTVFSPHQLESMERHFKQQQYVGSMQRSHIASQLGLTETQVKVWFQNRRIRWRKQMLDTMMKSS